MENYYTGLDRGFKGVYWGFIESPATYKFAKSKTVLMDNNQWFQDVPSQVCKHTVI